MDLQKTMEFIVEQQAGIVIRMDRFAEHMDQLAEYQLKLEEQRSAEMDQRSAEMERYMGRHAADMADIRAELRRGIRLSIEEMRRERVRRQSLATSLQELIETLKK